MPRAVKRAPLSELNRITIGALLLIAVALVYLQVILNRMFIPPVSVFAGLCVLVAGLIAAGWRWASLLAAGLVLVMLIGNWGPTLFDLQHPELTHDFGFALLLVATILVCVAAGLGAFVQRWRNPDALQAPRWVYPTLVGIGVLIVVIIAGAALIA
jgi:hypothetical protein